MDRPTCKTCPYWMNYSHLIVSDDETQEGKCLRFPPQWVGFAEKDDELPSINPGNWDQPSTFENEGCGEHPDFPAYVASFKADTVLVDGPAAMGLKVDDPTVGLSTRIINCLETEGMFTIGDVLKAPVHKWDCIRNFGAKSFDQLKAALERFGLTLLR